jgi:O-antigen biosynthesis protein WbqP
MKQTFNLLLGVTMLVLLLIPMLIIVVAIRLISKGPALYSSDRVGSNNKILIGAIQMRAV